MKEAKGSGTLSADFSLSQNVVDEVCDEIETQWEYLLMSRAIFHASFQECEEYQSPGFYAQRGMNFYVRQPSAKSASYQRASKGIAVWLNQNFVIRLYGILDSRGIMKYGLTNQLKIIKLISLLRNNIGAHSSGRNVSKRDTLISATTLINELFGRSVNIDEVEYYTLSIDSVLLPMKDQTQEMVKKIEYKPSDCC